MASSGFLDPLEIGTLLTIFLLGIHTQQTYTYFIRFPKDSRTLKSLVATLWLFEVIVAGSLSNFLFGMLRSLRSGQFTESDLSRPSNTFAVFMVVWEGVNTLLKVYFIHRIYILYRRLYLAIPLWILSALCFLIMVSCAVLSPKLEQYHPVYSALILSNLSITTLIYLVITVSLLWYLRVSGKDVRKSTTRLVKSLMKWTLANGIISSGGLVLTVVLFKILEHPFVWAGVSSAIQQLFSICFMASTNARIGLRTMLENYTVPTLRVTEPSAIRFSPRVENGTNVVDSVNQNQTPDDNV